LNKDPYKKYFEEPHVEEFFDHTTGKFYIRRTVDVEPILDFNNIIKNDTDGYSKSRVWRKIGSIPNIVVEKILREHGVNILDGSPEAEKYIKKFLNNNTKFRTVDRRV